MSSSDSVTVTTTVEVNRETAFRLFTEDVDVWWKHGPRFRGAGNGRSAMRFEGGEGGRLIEVTDDSEVFVLGRIVVWQPDERLVFEMGGRDFGPDDAWPEVEVLFEARDGGSDATLVTVVTRGFDAMPMSHPVRHGMDGEAFVSMMGVWWADLLGALRNHSSRRH